MRVNHKVKDVLLEIARQSINYSNENDKNKIYLKRLLKVFKENLNDEEQLFIFYTILEFIHYKNITIDPELVITMNNIKLKHYFLVILIGFGFFILAGIIFFQSGVLINFLESLINFLKFLKAI